MKTKNNHNKYSKTSILVTSLILGSFFLVEQACATTESFQIMTDGTNAATKLAKGPLTLGLEALIIAGCSWHFWKTKTIEIMIVGAGAVALLEFMMNRITVT